MDFLEQFGVDRPVLGMVHLPALPGSPGFDGDRDSIRSRALEDATALEAGGVDGIVLENFGDAPFYPEDVPEHVIAEMTAQTAAVTAAVDVPVGVNVLRNDAEAALSIAAATGASFVRVNVHVGAAATDQGVLEGKAHETVRLRERIDADVAILADVHVKHATPVGETSIEQVALETTERGLADGVIVSGVGTGAETQLEDVELVAETLGALEESVPVLVGSGVTSRTIGDCFDAGAGGVIVGTALKKDQETTNPVSRERVEAVVEAARDGA
ncbi:phosphorybosylanthranilate isomerase (plasmid) [Halostagnicola larsenii XH-48]|uniref:Phosphorybosylanthranilate isomerase n=1 Tax=Halostagnicola larsenii XH-48 TaxID=797299 RepID=W0JRV6_9EURY|nr:BtpA/SgcQ family protein [Halostagnicola larsenii]AHG01314.1 phosphorybosylanthranilate isomerase [Halostagnicola larsenii XH-48]